MPAMQPRLVDGRPESVGMSAERLKLVVELMDAAVRSHVVPGGTILAARHGTVVLEHAVGLSRVADNVPAGKDTIWICASLSKPITYMALLLLVERGRLVLDQPVRELIPEFAGADRAGVKVLHLMTHTSGLPDMLPDNEALRRRHSDLKAFIDGTCKAPLGFAPGTKVSYQSMGTLLCAHLVERLTGMRLRDFLTKELCGPLGLRDTYYGIRGPDGLKDRRLAMIHLAPEQAATDWNGNSPYWRELGAPWGAMQSTPREYAAFLHLLLNDGRYGDRQVLSLPAARAMIADQTARLPGLSAEQKLAEPWGLGWARQGTENRRFGDLMSPATFGHWGSTGTVAWADPTTGVLMVLMTNQPLNDNRTFWRRMGNAVAGATT
jgi:CubicO group peptidase (beta-lactamase class C family)